MFLRDEGVKRPSASPRWSQQARVWERRLSVGTRSVEKEWGGFSCRGTPVVALATRGQR